MTTQRFSSVNRCQMHWRALGLAAPALAVALGLLSALSPVARADDGLQFGNTANVGVPADSNGDGVADDAAMTEDGLQFGNTANFDNRSDSDADGLYDDDELYVYGTDPYWWDTDGDGSGDGEEVYYGTDPLEDQ